MLIILLETEHNILHTPESHFAIENDGYSQLGIVSLCVCLILTAPVEHRHQVVFSGLQPQGLVLLPQTVPPARPLVHVVLPTFRASPQECHPRLSWLVSYKNMTKANFVICFFLYPKFLRHCLVNSQSLNNNSIIVNLSRLIK